MVVSAPSGAGKTSICREFLRMFPDVRFSVSCTTRPPRPGEVDGRDYLFISKEEFRARIARGEFVEWVENYGELYGTAKKTMDTFLAQGCDLILDIEPRGAKAIREH
jgi:guanylate kinase